MKITQVKVFQLPLALRVPITLSGGRTLNRLTTTLLQLTSDEGYIGWGESCPWGSDYLPAFPEHVLAGIQVVAPTLLGLDPRDLTAINRRIEGQLLGQPAILTAVDMACHDLMARSLGIPVWRLLGGWVASELPVTGFVAPGTREQIGQTISVWRSQGIRQMAAKATGLPQNDIRFLREIINALAPDEAVKFDANCGWTLRDAIEVGRNIRDSRIRFEQPCRTYEECRAFSRSIGSPLILDETILGPYDVFRAFEDGVLGAVNIKIARSGGISRARLLRDLCVEMRVPIYLQDSGGSRVARSATVHLGHGIPSELLSAVWDCTAPLLSSFGRDDIRSTGSALAAGSTSGLGVDISFDDLGAAKLEIGC